MSSSPVLLVVEDVAAAAVVVMARLEFIVRLIRLMCDVVNAFVVGRMKWDAVNIVDRLEVAAYCVKTANAILCLPNIREPIILCYVPSVGGSKVFVYPA